MLLKVYIIGSLIGIVVFGLSLPFLNKIKKYCEYLEDIERRKNGF